MTALVTGATGFLGSDLTRLLRQRGEDVRVLVRRTSDRRRLAGLDLDEREGDITDRESVAKAIDGADVVYHVAAMYELGTTAPERMEKINVGGTTNVLEEAAEHGITTVYVSSVAALGPTGPEPVGEEHWAPEPAPSVYGRTKREAHAVFKRLAGEGAPVRAALPGMIYGPDDTSVLGTLLRLLGRGLLPIASMSDMRIGFVHVRDCADALTCIAERGRDGEEYIVSADVASVREWLAEAARVSGHRPPVAYLPFGVIRLLGKVGEPIAPLVGIPKPVVVENIAMVDGIHHAFSGEKARRELGWQPRPFADGLRETMEWYAGRR